jgi:glycerol-3-phosphate acyltransferase PlsY
MGAIYRREIGAFFTSSIAYVFLAVFYTITGFMLAMENLAGGVTNMMTVFTVMFVISLFMIPILTMRLFSEEKKQRTEQGLLTAPVPLTSIVLGKYFAAFFCVVGHMFPALYGFKGGKGILCSGTLLLCLNWRVALVGWGLFLVLWLTTRYVSLGSISAAISLPISTHFVYAGQGWVLLFASLISLLVLWAHRENIVRLLNGTEHKFKFHVNAPKKEDEK